MTDHQPAARRRASLMTALDGVLALMCVLLVTQMWLLTATLETDLAGHGGAALPSMIVSGILFAACAALLGLIGRLERRLR